jgi:hypothetical protein
MVHRKGPQGLTQLLLIALRLSRTRDHTMITLLS